jgi:hypothetical protein
VTIVRPGAFWRNDPLSHADVEVRSQPEQVILCRSVTAIQRSTESAESALGASMGQPRDWRHRGMGKGLVSDRDLNPHVCDLRRCVPGPYSEADNRRSESCMSVRGPSAPKCRCLLTSEFSVDAAGGAR